MVIFFFFSSRRRHTRCALVTGVQTCALPIFRGQMVDIVHDRPEYLARRYLVGAAPRHLAAFEDRLQRGAAARYAALHRADRAAADRRSEEQTSELQSLMRNSYAVFCLTKNTPIQLHMTMILKTTNT